MRVLSAMGNLTKGPGMFTCENALTLAKAAKCLVTFRFVARHPSLQTNGHLRTNVTILNKYYSAAAKCRKQRLLSRSR